MKTQESKNQAFYRKTLARWNTLHQALVVACGNGFSGVSIDGLRHKILQTDVEARRN